MKICIAADLHLPYNEAAAQYRALDFILADAGKKKADLLVFAGDITANGDKGAAERFLKCVNASGIPFLVIPGNSDLRSGTPSPVFASPTVSEINGVRIFMADDSDTSIADPVLDALDSAKKGDLVFMHHPKYSLSEPSRSRFVCWRSNHPEVMLFYAHIHKFKFSDFSVSLPALDPDKNIGEPPCAVYYDTDSGELEKAFYFCPMPVGFFERCGISCYRTEDDIAFSTAHRLSSLELRPQSINCDRGELKRLITEWRTAGGKNLSVHFPDVNWKNSEPDGWEKLSDFSAFAAGLGADRITIHVPRLTSAEASADGALDKLAAFYARLIDTLPDTCTVGIENLHMKDSDRANGTRPFGCVPEECLDLLFKVRVLTSHSVGINLDLGHARNNAPCSQKYSLGAWYAEVGMYCVGYHVHQVESQSGVFENHMPITGHYDKLISLASFYEGLSRGILAEAPVILEIRPEGGAAKSVAFYENDSKKRVHDLHSHTRYSFCGRDEPQALVDTAVANGISVLGICDHSYGIGDRKREYIAEIRALAAANADKIRILCGIEIPSLPHVYDFTHGDFSVISDYDYCLIEHITEPESIIGRELFDFTDKLKIPCGIAHTDMFAYCRMFGFDPETFFAEMAARGIFWEMNMSYDSIHGYRKHEYTERFLQSEEEQDIIRRSGLRLCVGFDGHRREDYDGARVHMMNEFLKSRGLATVEDVLF